MIAIINKFRIVLVLTIVLLSSAALMSCDKGELEIQDNFPFEVKIMPVPKDIGNGDSVEIRITIQGTSTQYFIRYFQFDGHGTLQYFDEPPYHFNDLYTLPAKQFRLYYTSASVVSQSFGIWISDNYGHEKQLSFQFNSGD